MRWTTVPPRPSFTEFFSLASGQTKKFPCKSAIGVRLAGLRFLHLGGGDYRVDQWAVDPDSYWTWNGDNPFTSYPCVPCTDAERDYRIVAAPDWMDGQSHFAIILTSEP
jgi:hypothetical protein